MKTSGQGWVVGRIHRPHTPLTVTHAGFTTAYSVCGIPLAVTIVTWQARLRRSRSPRDGWPRCSGRCDRHIGERPSDACVASLAAASVGEGAGTADPALAPPLSGATIDDHPHVVALHEAPRQTLVEELLEFTRDHDHSGLDALCCLGYVPPP